MDNKQSSDIAVRLQQVQANITSSLSSCENPAKKVILVAVSKTFSHDAIEPLLKAGQRVFGENRVQEASSKWPVLKKKYPDSVLHLIGPLQTNKTAAAVELFDCIETLDRPKLARAIAVEMKKLNKTVKLFIQVNIGAESQKAGVLMSELPLFLDLCRTDLKLNISGLMCIPPMGEDAEKYFLKLAQLAEKFELEHLSMGMSADYKTAIACGATHVRVGSAIFGER